MSCASGCGTVWSAPSTGLVDVLDGANRHEDDGSCSSWRTRRTKRCGAARPTGQGHRRLRCRHDRDDARVLPAGPLRAGHRRRRRSRGHPRRGRERPHGRGGRRPVPAQVRHHAQPAQVHPRGRDRDRPVCDQSSRRGSRPAALTATGHRLHAATVCRGRAQGDGRAQTDAQDPHLRRRADAPSQDSGRSRARAHRACAVTGTLRRRARRRVPGHRPGAVGDHGARLWPGKLDPRAHRRPQAGDLRLPRR